MADFSGLEMATGYRSLEGEKAKSERLFPLRCPLTAAMIVGMTFALLTLGFCFWNQRKLELENLALKESVLVLASNMETVQLEMAKAKKETYESNESSPDEVFSAHRRLKRSKRNGETKQRKTIPARDTTRAVHLRLDVDESTPTQLKWKTWTAGEARTKGGEQGHILTNPVRLSEDRTNVTIDEAGLYFVYAQIHFENAKPRNAFAMKVDNSFIFKCFQSLDHFDKALTLAENSRFKPCYSASSVVLRHNQVVSVVNLYPHRIYNDPFANFWGLIKLAD